MGATAYFVVEGDGTASLISFFLTLVVSFFTILSNFTRKVVEELEKRLYEKAPAVADWIFGKLENVVLRTWWAVTYNFQGKYFKRLDQRYRTYRTEGLKTKGPFTLDLEKVFVPLRLDPKSAADISPAMVQKARE